MAIPPGRRSPDRVAVGEAPRAAGRGPQVPRREQHEGREHRSARGASAGATPGPRAAARGATSAPGTGPSRSGTGTGPPVPPSAHRRRCRRRRQAIGEGSARNLRGVPASVLRVGCSGWVYRDWRGVVYPEALPSTRWFPGTPSTSTPSSSTAPSTGCPPPPPSIKWAEQAPPGFVYAAKVGQFATHRKKLVGSEWWLPRHLERIRLLGEHLGPNLFQLPPHWKANAARLEEVCARLPGDIRWAVELRDRSWLRDDVLQVLRDHDVALCVHDLLADHPFELTASWTYVRFHGTDAIANPYHGRYGPRRLRRWVDRLGRGGRGRRRRVVLLQQRLVRQRVPRRDVARRRAGRGAPDQRRRSFG